MKNKKGFAKLFFILNEIVFVVIVLLCVSNYWNFSTIFRIGLPLTSFIFTNKIWRLIKEKSFDHALIFGIFSLAFFFFIYLIFAVMSAVSVLQ